MEKAIREKNTREKNDEMIELIAQECAELTEDINAAQYGLGELDERGEPVRGGMTGEEIEIDRIENQSLPSLRTLLKDLKN